MAPTLYFNVVVSVWREQCSEVWFLCCRKLVRDHTRLLRVKVTGSQFADDLALYAVNHATF